MKRYNRNENENDEISVFGSGREKRHWISKIENANIYAAEAQYKRSHKKRRKMMNPWSLVLSTITRGTVEM